jgi:hypothetical protein
MQALEELESEVQGVEVAPIGRYSLQISSLSLSLSSNSNSRLDSKPKLEEN